MVAVISEVVAICHGHNVAPSFCNESHSDAWSIRESFCDIRLTFLKCEVKPCDLLFNSTLKMHDLWQFLSKTVTVIK
jgi:hypothetical protein